jgi:membrane protease YdiL (CAAX protease family)
VFSILGTVMYLVLGGAALLTLAQLGRLNPIDLLAWRISGEGAALTLLAGIGASALTAFAMSVLHSLPGRADVPGAVSDVRWVQEILALPGRWRAAIPMVSGALEEFYFRGVMLFGLLATGFPVWAALVITGVIFTAGQVALTESRVQATVLAASSIVLSVVCGLLTIVEGSVLPAMLIHASFAGYYTNMSVRRTAVAANPPR